MYEALLGVAGGGLGAVGADQQRRAMRGASNAYQRDLGGYYADEEAVGRGFRDQYRGVSDARLGQIGTTLGQYMAPEYGQRPSDTATMDAALAAFKHGNPGAGGTGAASGWGERVAARTGAATDRMRTIAGDASSLRRVGDQQSGALLDMSVADQRFGRQVSDIQNMEQVRRADLARLLQDINARGQHRFDKASRQGRDWMTVGSLVGASGQLMDAYGATQQQPAQSQYPNWRSQSSPSQNTGYEMYS